MNTRVMQRKIVEKLRRLSRQPAPGGESDRTLPPDRKVSAASTVTARTRQRGEASLLAALCILAFLIWMSAIPLLYFQRLMELGKHHGRVQLLTAVNEEIHQETIRHLQQWLLPRIAMHLQTALEVSPAFWNELINGRDPLPTDEYRKMFFKRSFFVPHERITAEKNTVPVRDPRLNSVRSYLDSIGSGVIIDTEYVGLSSGSLPDAPEYIVACHIRSLTRAEDGGEQVRVSRFTCLFRPQRARPEETPAARPDFPVLTLYPLYTE